MDGGVAFRLVVPLERAVGEIDLRIQVLPQSRNLLALCDGVGRNESAARRRALDEVICLLVPAADEVEVFVLWEECEHVSFLRCVHAIGTCAQKRRIAEDVGEGLRTSDVGHRFFLKSGVRSQKSSPVHAQRVRANDMRGVLDRDTGEILPEAVGDLHVAEVIHQPQRDLRDFGGELLDLNAVELRDRNLAELRDVEELLA